MRKDRKELQSNIKQVINEIKGKKEITDRIKEKMLKHGIVEGRVRKIMIGQEDIGEVEYGTLYLLAIELYKITKDKRINPSLFGLYNSEIKSQFLNLYPKNTQFTYLRIFEHSSKDEEIYGKDLFDFSVSEIEYVLHKLEPLTHSASHVNGRIVTKYIDWAIEQNLTMTKVNILKDKPMNWFEQFVDKDVQLYFTVNDLRKIEEECANWQDMALIRLLFEGVEGRSLSELRNMKKDDVKKAMELGYLEVTNEDGDKRIIEFFDKERTLYLLNEAVEQSTYYKKNGVIEDESIGIETNLVDNDYVFRSSITRTESHNKPIEKMALYRRIKTLNETLGYPYLTTKNIVRSGMIYMGKQMLKSYGKLNKEHYIEICDRYNVNNWYPVRKKYCSEEVIRKIYSTDDNPNQIVV